MLILTDEGAPPVPAGGARIVAAWPAFDPGLWNGVSDADYEILLPSGETLYRDRGAAEALMGREEMERFDAEQEDRATPALFKEELP